VLMTSVAMPMAAIGAIGVTLAGASPAQAAVIIGDRNKLKERPRRNYRSLVRIDRDLEGQETEFNLTGEVRFFAPDGTPGPLREIELAPRATSKITSENPIFVAQTGAATNVLAGRIVGGGCDGIEFNIEFSLEPNEQTDFIVCENGESSIEGRAFITEGGKPRAFFTAPSDINARSELYGRILIKGQPLEMERTVYTGDVNDVEDGALTGFTYEQTITVTNLIGTVLDTQTTRGVVGEDETIEIDPDFDGDSLGPNMTGTAANIRRGRVKEKSGVRPHRVFASVIAGEDANAANFSSQIGIQFPSSDNVPDVPSITLDSPDAVRLAYRTAEGEVDVEQPLQIKLFTQTGGEGLYLLEAPQESCQAGGVVRVPLASATSDDVPKKATLSCQFDRGVQAVFDGRLDGEDNSTSIEGVTINGTQAEFHNQRLNFGADLDDVEPDFLNGEGYIQTVTLRNKETDRIIDESRIFGVVGASGSERELSGFPRLRLKANAANRAVLSGTFAQSCRLDDEPETDTTLEETLNDEPKELCGTTDHFRVNITDVTSQEVLLEQRVDLIADQRDFDANLPFEDPLLLIEQPDEAIFSISIGLIENGAVSEILEIQDVTLSDTFDGIDYRIGETESGKSIGAALILREGETVPLLSISVAGEGVENVTGIFIENIENIGDGSATPAERDFIIPLSHEYVDFSVRGKSKNFGTSETQRIDYNVSGSGIAFSGQIEGTDYQSFSQNHRSRGGSFGDEPIRDDASGALVAGKGSGTKRSTSSARARPQLQ